jgi:hypothetical protein
VTVAMATIALLIAVMVIGLTRQHLVVAVAVSSAAAEVVAGAEITVGVMIAE